MSEVNKHKQEPFEFNQYLSMIDLGMLQPERFKKYAESNFTDEKILEEMLFYCGADIKCNGYEMYMQTHKPRVSDKPVHCQRFVFTERTDKWWIDNGMMVEDIIRNHKSEIVRVGMLLAMNTERKMDEVQAAKLSSQVTNVDIKVQEDK